MFEFNNVYNNHFVQAHEEKKIPKELQSMFVEKFGKLPTKKIIHIGKRKSL